MPPSGVGKQIKAIAMGSDDFADAADQMSIRREATTGEESFELRYQIVELAD